MILNDEFHVIIFQFPSLNLPTDMPKIHASNRRIQPLPHAQPIITGSGLTENQRGMYDDLRDTDSNKKINSVSMFIENFMSHRIGLIGKRAFL